MDSSKFKCFFGVAVILAILLAPFALEITPDGQALAFSSKPKNRGGFHAIEKGGKKNQTSWSEYQTLHTNNADSLPAPQPVPEPTTMLLVGSGLAGLAVLRKKFKK